MKRNGVVCYPGPALLFFIFRFEYLISGPKSYRDFRETGREKLLLFTFKIEVTSFADNMIKLSNNKTKWTGLLTRTRAFVL